MDLIKNAQKYQGCQFEDSKAVFKILHISNNLAQTSSNIVNNILMYVHDFQKNIFHT